LADIFKKAPDGIESLAVLKGQWPGSFYGVILTGVIS